MKTLFNRIKSFFSSSFNRNQEKAAVPNSEISTDKSLYKTVKKMNALQEELIKTNEAFNKHIAEAQAEYKTVEDKFNVQYDELLEIHSQVRKGIVPLEKAEAKQVAIEPLKTAVHDTGTHLETIKGYHKESVLELVSDMQALSPAYAEEVAKVTGTITAELTDIRQEYLKKLNELALHYKQIADTDVLIANTLLQNGINHTPVIAGTHNRLTEDIKLSMNSLTVTPEAVSNAFKYPRPV